MKTLAVYNVKGGVGKSATAVNVAYLASAAGLRTLLWDLDPQGAASWYLHGKAPDVKAKHLVEGETALTELVQDTAHDALKVIPASESYRSFDVALRKVPPREGFKPMLKPFAKSFDLLVLDCPPSLSNLADQVFHAADLVLVPVVPTHLSLRAYKQLHEYFEREDFSVAKLKPFYSMADRRRLLHQMLIDQPPKLLRSGFRSCIPYASAIEKMGEHRAPVNLYADATPAGEAYRGLWKEVKKALEL